MPPVGDYNEALRTVAIITRADRPRIDTMTAGKCILIAHRQATVRDASNALAGLGFYVFSMLGFSAIYQATVKLGLWRIGVESMTFDGLGVLDRVKARGAASSAVGEGLADALNVGGI